MQLTHSCLSVCVQPSPVIPAVTHSQVFMLHRFRNDMLAGSGSGNTGRPASTYLHSRSALIIQSLQSSHETALLTACLLPKH